jgi:succinoglycan biosynthesis transport protein ExoP
LLQASLGIDFIKETNIIVVSFSWADPRFAAHALDTVIDAYRQQRVKLLNNTQGAGEFYTSQVARAEEKLQQVNAETSAYLAASAVTDPVSEKQITMSLVSGLERQLSDAQVIERQTRQLLVTSDEKYKQTNEWLETPALPNLALPALADFDARYTDLLTRRTILLATRQPTSRDVQDIDGAIRSLRSAKLRSLTNFLNDRLGSQLEEEHLVSERLAEQRAGLRRLNEITEHYVSLIDRRDQILSQAKMYRNQIESLNVSKALDERGFESVVVLNKAAAPDAPTAPRKSLILGLAAAFGALFAIAYVIVCEYFDHTFASNRDVARVLGLRVVATVPRIHSVATAGRT